MEYMELYREVIKVEKSVFKKNFFGGEEGAFPYQKLEKM